MTIGPMSQCGACEHFRSPFSEENVLDLDGPFCAAFPAGIPDRVYGNAVDHRQPVQGDHGVRWESNGEEFPAYAFRPEVLST